MDHHVTNTNNKSPPNCKTIKSTKKQIHPTIIKFYIHLNFLLKTKQNNGKKIRQKKKSDLKLKKDPGKKSEKGIGKMVP